MLSENAPHLSHRYYPWLLSSSLEIFKLFRKLYDFSRFDLQLSHHNFWTYFISLQVDGCTNECLVVYRFDIQSLKVLIANVLYILICVSSNKQILNNFLATGFWLFIRSLQYVESGGSFTQDFCLVAFLKIFLHQLFLALVVTTLRTHSCIV